MYYLENYHFKAGLLVEKMASFSLSIIQFEGHIQIFLMFCSRNWLKEEQAKRRTRRVISELSSAQAYHFS